MKSRKDLYLERMFETRSEAWEKVGLAMDFDDGSVRRARRQAVLLLPLAIAVIVAWSHIWDGTGRPPGHPRLEVGSFYTPLRIATALVVLGLGWAVARDVGKVAGPTFFRRMDPATAGTVGFVIRLGTLGISILVALGVAGVSAGALVAGSAFTAVIVGLAAQQTLGNVIAGMVLLTARPFRVGERVRLQAGAVGGTTEGVVGSLGLLYTILQRGEDRIMIPNNVVLAAVVVPLREPDSVDVTVRLGHGVRPSHVQALLDDTLQTPMRSSATVLLQEIDGEDVVVRVQATPERAIDGAKLADEIIDALSNVTREHPVVEGQESDDSSSDGTARQDHSSDGTADQADSPGIGREADSPGIGREADSAAIAREADSPGIARQGDSAASPGHLSASRAALRRGPGQSARRPTGG